MSAHLTGTIRLKTRLAGAVGIKTRLAGAVWLKTRVTGSLGAAIVRLGALTYIMMQNEYDALEIKTVGAYYFIRG